MAKEKGINISLIAFEDSESQIEILKGIAENSGGDNYQIYNQFNRNMNSFNNNLGMNNMQNMNMGMNNLMNNNFGMNNMMNNNLGMNNMQNMNMGMNNIMNNNDMLSGQIYQFANTSQNRQCVMFNRFNKK